VAFVETGQYNELWPEVHMLPAQSVQAFLDLKAKQYFPVHWGMFNLAFHTWYEPIVKLNNAARASAIHLLSPMLGELVDVDGNDENELWWKTACSENCVAGP
jgi:L-ascorbate metabolism protein UlaG (beta-lactamase superfamily)